MAPLHGRDDLLTDLVSHLVGLRYSSRVHARQRHDLPPLVWLVGGRGTGKSALLRDLEDAYGPNTPHVHADLAARDFAVPGVAALTRAGLPNTSPLGDLLHVLAYQLSQEAADRRLRFPRLVAGLLSVTRPQPDRPREAAAREERAELLLKAAQPDDGTRQALLRPFLIYLTQFGLVANGFPAPSDELLGEVVTRLLGANRLRRKAVRWWQERDLRGGGDGDHKLEVLRRYFRQPGENRRLAEAHLVAALLADAADAHGALRRFDGTPRPLALLDNAHLPPGPAFADLLAGASRAAPGAERGPCLIVVAAALGSETAHALPGTDAVYDAELVGARADQGRLVLGLQPLTRGAVWSMFDGSQQLPLGDLARLIHRFSAGRAGVAWPLVQAGGRRPDAGALLSLPGPDGGTVAGDLLRGLLPEDGDRERLLRLAPALSRTAADRLQPEYGQAIAYLRHNHWPRHDWPGTDGPLIGDPGLRALLLHELSGRGPGWDDAHRTLRGLYAEDDPRHLHHCLAMGEPQPVIRALHGLFARRDAPAVLAALNTVCAAPQPPVRPLPADDPSGCRFCPADANGPETHSAIGELVHALWQQSAPLATPDSGWISAIELRLGTLADYSRQPATAVYLWAQERWPELLTDWAQAPHLPVPGRDDL